MLLFFFIHLHLAIFVPVFNLFPSLPSSKGDGCTIDRTEITVKELRIETGNCVLSLSYNRD